MNTSIPILLFFGIFYAGNGLIQEYCNIGLPTVAFFCFRAIIIWRITHAYNINKLKRVTNTNERYTNVRIHDDKDVSLFYFHRIINHKCWCFKMLLHLKCLLASLDSHLVWTFGQELWSYASSWKIYFVDCLETALKVKMLPSLPAGLSNV